MNSPSICVLITMALSISTSFLDAQEKESIKLDGNTSRVVISPWKKINIDTTAHFRGLHVVDDNVVWASGSKGTVIVSADGGKSWQIRVVEGAETLDFRDIHAFDDGSAIIISSGDIARIYRTNNGGRSWKPCGEKEGAFFDALSFWDDSNGILMSDPIDGRVWLATTNDGGKSWAGVSKGKVPVTNPGEAGFAASGTNMCTVGDATCLIGLGGARQGQIHKSSRVLISKDFGKTWQFGGPVPIERSPSSGIFSLCFSDDVHGVAVGGDYLNPDKISSNYATTRDGGKTWKTPKPRVPPTGYRGCVAAFKKGREVRLVTVGTNGTDMSTDLGNKWVRISNKGFNSVGFSKSGNTGWAVGQNGSVARWVLP